MITDTTEATDQLVTAVFLHVCEHKKRHCMTKDAVMNHPDIFFFPSSSILTVLVCP